MKKYGYIRVSTKEQNLERQIVAMKNEGIEDIRIFSDQVSGNDFNRPQYNRLVKKLKQKKSLLNSDRQKELMLQRKEEWDLEEKS